MAKDSFYYRRFELAFEWITGADFSRDVEIVDGLAVDSAYNLDVYNLEGELLENVVITPVGNVITLALVDADYLDESYLRYDLYPDTKGASYKFILTGSIKRTPAVTVEKVTAKLRVSGGDSVVDLQYSQDGGTQVVLAGPDPTLLTSPDGTVWKPEIDNAGVVSYVEVVEEEEGGGGGALP